MNDLVQVVFIRAFYSLHQLRDASKFGEWICTIAKNEALKYQKYKKKTRTVPFSSFTGEELEIEGGITPENILDEKEILEIIDQLPKGYRRIFQMAEIEGYSHKEIAAKLGIESHSSSSQLTRTKEMLRKIINKRMMTFIAIQCFVFCGKKIIRNANLLILHRLRTRMVSRLKIGKGRKKNRRLIRKVKWMW